MSMSICGSENLVARKHIFTFQRLPRGVCAHHMHTCHQQEYWVWLCAVQVVLSWLRRSSISARLHVQGKNTTGPQLPIYLSLNGGALVVLSQHLIFNHSTSRALFSPHFALIPKAWLVEKMLETPQNYDFVIMGCQLPCPAGDRRVAVWELHKTSTARKELSEEKLSGLQIGNRKEPQAGEGEVTDITIEGSFMSFIQWSKTWAKNFIIQTRCWFCNILVNDELFQFSLILNM